MIPDTKHDVTELSDYDLLVEMECAIVLAFGDGERAADQVRTVNRRRYGRLLAQAAARGLVNPTGTLTDRGKALHHGEDPRLVALLEGDRYQSSTVTA